MLYSFSNCSNSHSLNASNKYFSINSISSPLSNSFCLIYIWLFHLFLYVLIFDSITNSSCNIFISFS
ncbi:MAG: hypothetical protein Q8S84_02300 [bacterium]|nr:hypothetical protein [bacterium]MDP3380384.1 hypothetical protein [bacterium]